MTGSRANGSSQMRHGPSRPASGKFGDFFVDLHNNYYHETPVGKLWAALHLAMSYKYGVRSP